PAPVAPPVERKKELEREKQLASEREAHRRAAAAATVRRQAVPSRVMIAGGPVVGFGVVGDPILYGSTLAAVFVRGLLRAGGSLSLVGAPLTAAGYDLSFLRLVLAPRLGIGWERGRVDVELSAGPGLRLLHTDARVDTHTNVSFAVVGGARFG